MSRRLNVIPDIDREGYSEGVLVTRSFWDNLTSNLKITWGEESEPTPQPQPQTQMDNTTKYMLIGGGILLIVLLMKK